MMNWHFCILGPFTFLSFSYITGETMSVSSLALLAGIVRATEQFSHQLSCSPKSAGVRFHQPGSTGHPPGPLKSMSIEAAISQKNAPLGVIVALQMFWIQQLSRSLNHSSS